MTQLQERTYLYVVVDGAITHESPRAWVFDTEEAAVDFRCKHVEMYARRRGSLSPVYRCELNSTDKTLAMLEIDWKKHQLPPPVKHKKFQ